jgi:hypothetical protein
VHHDITILLVTAASIGFIHTLLGPDHYIPFVAMAKSGPWSLRKTIAVVLVCGLGHVGSSVIIGALGIGLGWALGAMEALETMRGDWAALALIGFGLAYMIWGIHR